MEYGVSRRFHNLDYDKMICTRCAEEAIVVLDWTGTECPGCVQHLAIIDEIVGFYTLRGQIWRELTEQSQQGPQRATERLS